MEAFQRVKKNQGSAGVDNETLEEYERDLRNNLYKLWNRMSSGSYFPPPVKLVEIPKKDGGKRPLGIPTVSDRIAQTVVKMTLEPILEPFFHPDSYGYRPHKSAIEAVGKTRERCWRYDWVIDWDIKGFFNNIQHDLLWKALHKHTDNQWVLLYIQRWLNLYEPPYAERHVRWCERTVRELIPHFLLNFEIYFQILELPPRSLRRFSFFYSKEEYDAMKADIIFCKERGAKGVVMGILKADGSVDIERMKELVDLAKPMQETFHRAFDMTADPFKALEDIISLGIERILTSGQASIAIKGVDLIQQLNNRANNRIIIMPGGGINEGNIPELKNKTNAIEFHGSLQSLRRSQMIFMNQRSLLGRTSENETWMETDPVRVRNLLEKLI